MERYEFVVSNQGVSVVDAHSPIEALRDALSLFDLNPAEGAWLPCDEERIYSTSVQRFRWEPYPS